MSYRAVHQAIIVSLSAAAPNTVEQISLEGDPLAPLGIPKGRSLL
ncbi:hypothetical protein [Thermosynechococcus vestitus]|nr:hypothetical protein [Thermosynechococcus vestitus]